MRAAQALVEFYAKENATAQPTPFGMITCMFTHATPEAIFNKLSSARIGNHFTVIEVNDNDEPIKMLTSFNGATTVTGTNVRLDNEAADEGKTKEELEAELNTLLDKIQQFGQDRLTPTEKERLEYLSNLE